MFSIRREAAWSESELVYPPLSYLYDDSGRDPDSPQLSRSRLSPEGVAWDRSEVAGFARNIFSSVLNISPQSLLPSPPTEAPYSLEDVVQHFLKTAPTNRRLELLRIKEGRDKPDVEENALVAEYLKKVTPGIAREFQV